MIRAQHYCRSHKCCFTDTQDHSASQQEATCSKRFFPNPNTRTQSYLVKLTQLGNIFSTFCTKLETLDRAS